eukprot:15459212-Alexandrium_andersonii.AAC.1
MRHGEAFDVCVHLRFKFVGERFRTVIENIKGLPRLSPQEEHAVSASVGSGLLDESRLPPNIPLRVELIHAEGSIHGRLVPLGGRVPRL